MQVMTCAWELAVRRDHGGGDAATEPSSPVVVTAGPSDRVATARWDPRGVTGAASGPTQGGRPVQSGPETAPAASLYHPSITLGANCLYRAILVGFARHSKPVEDLLVRPVAGDGLRRGIPYDLAPSQPSRAAMRTPPSLAITGLRRRRARRASGATRAVDRGSIPSSPRPPGNGRLRDPPRHRMEPDLTASPQASTPQEARTPRVPGH